ncbi:MAG: four helix bundle protein [Bacteroidetes bacterium]|nr:four helix bundle protein [Bacteroidota bacterium]
MGTIKNFEDLEIWMISRELVNLIYSDLRKCHDFAFKDQITRAGISSMNNIAEGFCRSSDSEFKQFLNISKGSSGEVKSMYYKLKTKILYLNQLQLKEGSEFKP